jgi:hypothetical protein
MSTEKHEQYFNGQKAIFSRAPELKDIAHKLITRLAKDPDIQNMIVTGNRGDLDNLLFGCITVRSGKYQANIRDLKAHLGNLFELWVQTLRESSGYVEPEKDERFLEFTASLGIQYPAVNWKEFEVLLKSEFTRDPFALKNMLFDACSAASFLAGSGETYTQAELGAKCFGDSKYLKNNTALNSWINRLLLQLQPQQENAGPVFAENPTASTVTLSGPFEYETNGRRMTWIRELWELGQSAILNAENLAPMENLSVPLSVVTIENESTFNRMKEFSRNHALVYTAGYPGRAVCRLIGLLAPSVELRHWGDSDPEGYEIAAVLHQIHRLRLLNCTAIDLQRCKDKCRPLTPAKRKKAERLSQNPEFPFKTEIGWMLLNDLWLEQENFPLR